MSSDRPSADAPHGAELAQTTSDAIDHAGEPPVVMRLVIEIRSDGTRTIARGAAEDAVLGQKVAIQAEGRTPLALALSLAKTLFDVPALARTAARAVLAGRKGPKDDE